MNFLRKKIDAEDLLESIKVELKDYIRTRNKLGASNSIIFEGDLKPYDLNKQYIIYLFRNYLENNLGEWDLEYLIQWIQMTEIFDGSVIEELVFIFSTPEINYPINKANISEAIRFLDGDIPQPNYFGRFDNKLYRSKIVI